MKLIPIYFRNFLKKPLFAEVDDINYEYLNTFSWFIKKGQNTVYAVTLIDNKHVYMHQMVLCNNDDNLTIDHGDGKGLNNQQLNLRLATKSQQAQNSLKRRNSLSNYKGVYYHKVNQKWVARISCKGIKRNLGNFKTEIAAAKAYNIAAKELFGEFALLNKILEMNKYKTVQAGSVQ